MALNVTTQIEVLAAIKDLNSAAMCITRDLAVVPQVADRIMVLRQGDLVEEGRTEFLRANPRRSDPRELLSVRKGGGERVAHPEKGQRLLEMSDVSATCVDGVPGLRHEVTRSKTVALVGESGGSTSTLARVITGLLPAEAGHILLGLSTMRGAKKQNRVRELLEQIELPDHYAGRYPSELSGGEKQHVAIARTLAAQPDLINCDEVTPALDQLVAAEIPKLLQRLQNELGVSYLFITHGPCHSEGHFGRDRGHARGQGGRAWSHQRNPGTAASRVHGDASRIGAGDGP